MMEQKFKPPDRPKFIFKPRTVDQIRSEDKLDPASFLDIDKFDREIVVDNYYGELHPLEDWSDLKINAELKSNIERSYKKVRKIQANVIPLVLDHHDLKVQAETGAGKSAAFLIPIIHRIMEEKFENKITAEPEYKFCRPKAVIIEPSRELAIQVYEQALKLTDKTGVNVSICFGEFDYNENSKFIWNDKGLDILIATVGRLTEFCKDGVVSNMHLMFLVLDEADLLIMDRSMESIQEIINLSTYSKSVQTLMFSATYPHGSQQYIEKLLKPSYVYVHNDLETALSTRVLQNFVQCTQCEKLERLAKTLMTEIKSSSEHPRIMVFTNTKKSAELIKEYLTNLKIKCLALTGNLTAGSRIDAMNEYRSANPPIIVATDLVARGMDIKNLNMVINYSLPINFATYVHRIGRTGRMKFGRALTFIDTENIEELSIINELVAMLLNENFEVPSWLLEKATGVREENGRYVYGFGSRFADAEHKSGGEVTSFSLFMDAYMAHSDN